MNGLDYLQQEDPEAGSWGRSDFDPNIAYGDVLGRQEVFGQSPVPQPGLAAVQSPADKLESGRQRLRQIQEQMRQQANIEAQAYERPMYNVDPINAGLAAAAVAQAQSPWSYAGSGAGAEAIMRQRQKLEDRDYARRIAALKTRTGAEKDILQTEADILQSNARAREMPNRTTFQEWGGKKYKIVTDPYGNVIEEKELGEGITAAKTRAQFINNTTKRFEGMQDAYLKKYDNDPNKARQALERDKQAAINQALTDNGLAPLSAGEAATSTAPIVSEAELAGHKKQAEEGGKSLSKRYETIVENGMAASGRIGMLNQIEDLLEGAYTGTGGEEILKAQKVFEAFGVTLGKGAAPKEAAAALLRKLTLEAKNAGGTNMMPGSMSDSDRKYLEGMTPSLTTTPEGRKIILNTMRKLSERDQKIAEMADLYKEEHGDRLDTGFNKQLREFSKANPMFGGKEAAPVAASTAPSSKYKEGQIARFPGKPSLIFKGGKWLPFKE